TILMQSNNQRQRTWRLIIIAIILIVLVTPFLYLQYKSQLRQENALPEQPLQEETEDITPKASPQDMVNLAEFIPGIEVDLRYATPNNFTGAIIYDDDTAYL